MVLSPRFGINLQHVVGRWEQSQRWMYGREYPNPHVALTRPSCCSDLNYIQGFIRVVRANVTRVSLPQGAVEL